MTTVFGAFSVSMLQNLRVIPPRPNARTEQGVRRTSQGETLTFCKYMVASPGLSLARIAEQVSPKTRDAKILSTETAN